MTPELWQRVRVKVPREKLGKLPADLDLVGVVSAVTPTPTGALYSVRFDHPSGPIYRGAFRASDLEAMPADDPNVIPIESRRPGLWVVVHGRCLSCANTWVGVVDAQDAHLCRLDCPACGSADGIGVIVPTPAPQA